jgi:hypothetical protein
VGLRQRHPALVGQLRGLNEASTAGSIDGGLLDSSVTSVGGATCWPTSGSASSHRSPAPASLGEAQPERLQRLVEALLDESSDTELEALLAG